MAAKRRLDALLVERGLVESRSRAQALVMAGRVHVDGTPVTKAGTATAADATVEVIAPARYVSRGGEKLETALAVFRVELAGERCLDVGASTGGFTDCLLQHGAASVVALDVGRNQLHERLMADSRVTVIDGANARSLDCDSLPFRPTLVTADVSFISLRLVLPAVLGCAQEPWRALTLVKPQFEAGRGDVRRGVVRDPEVRRRVLHDFAEFATERGWAVLGVCDSCVPGPAGNREYVVYLASPAHPLRKDQTVDVADQIERALTAP
ncbi:MAG TPA: TlyA family RNA methyltransferase [Gaiellales bacterium]|nr:TlyA family RNA methyltransferase [Gaiellales bacterium]